VSIRIATGIARRGDAILLVASRYANLSAPLWTLPGGRQEPRELASETVEREVREETNLLARVGELAYASESYDGETHVANLTFAIVVEGEPQVPVGHDHVVAAAWVPIAEIHERMRVAVVREPLLAYLGGSPHRYYGFHDAGVTIRWFS
jgi:ADP-ribose pyrophosphatase YjhB (NUDIX family)